MSKTMREWEEQRYREREGKIQEKGEEQYSQTKPAEVPQPWPFPTDTPSETEDALTRAIRHLRGLAGIQSDLFDEGQSGNSTY